MAIAQGFVLERVLFAVLGLLIIFAVRLYGNACGGRNEGG